MNYELYKLKTSWLEKLGYKKIPVKLFSQTNVFCRAHNAFSNQEVLL